MDYFQLIIWAFQIFQRFQEKKPQLTFIDHFTQFQGRPLIREAGFAWEEDERSIEVLVAFVVHANTGYQDTANGSSVREIERTENVKVQLNGWIWKVHVHLENRCRSDRNAWRAWHVELRSQRAGVLCNWLIYLKF